MKCGRDLRAQGPHLGLDQPAPRRVELGEVELAGDPGGHLVGGADQAGRGVRRADDEVPDDELVAKPDAPVMGAWFNPVPPPHATVQIPIMMATTAEPPFRARTAYGRPSLGSASSSPVHTSWHHSQTLPDMSKSPS